jgi:teichuronic acid biosynthesis glycosyltransferase TuaC
MRILTFSHLFPDSIRPVWGIFVYQRIRHFCKRSGNTAIVVAPVPYLPRWFPSKSREHFKHIPREEEVGGIVVQHPRYLLVPKLAMPVHGLLLFLGSYWTVAKLHRQAKFDCIDAHFVYPDGFAAVLLGRVLGIPVFCSARGTDITVYPTFRLIRPLIRWSLRKAAGVIAVSQSLKQAMTALGIPEDKIRVIGNGIDAERFRLMDRQEARRKLELPLDGPLLVAVGSLHEHKGHAMLISAVAEMANRHDGLRLCIIGEGPLRERLQRLIAEKGLAGRVKLVGSVQNQELTAWFNAADVSCLPSSREGWPNVLLESLACGTPVVATRVGGVAEVIVSPDYGILVGQSVPELSEGIEAALQKVWDREAIHRYAKSRTWDQVALEMEEFMAERIPIQDPALAAVER